jgi:GNAT superfamily N-acetyltransferase
MIVRQATEADSSHIGEIQVLAWQKAHRGALPDDYLDSLDPTARSDHWSSVLRQTTHLGSRVIIAASNGPPRGFACFGAATALKGAGELHSMNVIPSAWRQGYGTALIRVASEQLMEMGFSDAILWTSRHNARAQKFYSSHGWQPDGATRMDNVLNEEIPQVRFARVLTS